MVENLGNDIGNFNHVRFLHAAGCGRRRTDPDAAGHHRACRIIGNRIFIDGNADVIQQPFSYLTGQIAIAHIKQQQMVVGAAGNQDKAVFH